MSRVSRETALEDDIRVGDAERRGAGKLGPPVSIFDDEQRGKPVAVLNTETSGGQLEIRDGLRVEGARDTEKAIGVVDLDTVHDGEVLIGRTPSDR